MHIEKGSYLLLCGQSGSGKTTLLRHLKTVLTPHGIRSGSILFDGTPLNDLPQSVQSASIGFVMQNPDDQIVTDKVWHELAFGLESLGCDENAMRLRVAEMASYFGIQNWFYRDVAELSGGQKQLLNLASIMAMQPEVLILDEPTSQLDPIAASDFLSTVKKINQELGTTIIITEHRLEDIYSIADRIVVMEHGSIIANDTPRNVSALLKSQNSAMFGALPAPVRIFHKAGASGDCPLTVREGRKWLSEQFLHQPPCIDSLNDNLAPKEVPSHVLRIKQAWFRYEKNSPDVLRGLDVIFADGILLVPRCQFVGLACEIERAALIVQKIIDLQTVRHASVGQSAPLVDAEHAADGVVVSAQLVDILQRGGSFLCVHTVIPLSNQNSV